MTTREEWLRGLGWQGAAPDPVAGDASARRYWRLREPGRSAILMEDPGGPLARFADLSAFLNAADLSAPRVLARDDAAGRMLLEDFGDQLFAREIAADPEREIPLYEAAAEALARLHDHRPPQDLPLADPNHLTGITDLFFDRYLPFAGHPDDPAQRARIETALRDLLDTHAAPQDVVILRDFHAENLLWLPDRDGPRRAGLIDFQDALTGHRAYDMASLTRDARRDVTPAAAEAATLRYLSLTGLPRAEFEASLATLAVQRNLRILGIFVRLATDAGKPRYLSLLPRVMRHIQADLAHPALAALAPLLKPLLVPRQPRAAMLFAAGFGTRMRDLTRDRPKPLIPVGGRSLLDHALDQIDGSSPCATVVNAHYLSDRIAAHLAPRDDVRVVVEVPDILDTGGGLKNALPLLPPGPVFTLNTDMIWIGPNPLNVLREAWDPDRMRGLLLCVSPDRAIGRKGGGDFAVDDAGRVTRPGGLVYTGAQILCTETVSDWPETTFSLNAIWNRLIAAGDLFACLYPGTWCDVGTPEGIAEAEAAQEAAHV